MKRTILSLIPKFVCMMMLTSITGCSSISYIPGSDLFLKFIPGSDRIFHKNSEAEVGPVLTASGEVVAGTQPTETAPPERASVAESQQVKTPAPVVVKAKEKAVSASPDRQPLVQPPQVKAPAPSAPSAPSAIPSLPKTQPTRQEDYSVKGKVALVTKDGTISPSGVIVRLHRIDGTALVPQDKTKTHVVDMENKSYAPGQMVINKGDTIRFLNKDEIRHNVFSSTGANAFDLGTFGGGLQRGVTLNKDGIAKVYCNIHPQMAAFVAIDEVGISQVVKNDSGAFEFNNLPSGDYRLTLWSVRGKHTELFSFTDEKQVTLDITLDTSNYKPGQHIDKFGKSYKKSIKREYY